MSLKQVREHSGMSQRELAERAGLHIRTIQYLEAGGQPRVKTAQVLARELASSVDELFPVEAAS